jgi:hypothetical protein
MKFTYAIAAAACLMTAPAVAAPAATGDAPIVLAQVGLDVQVGGDRDRDHDRGGVVVRERDHDVRGRVEIGEGRRSFARERIVVRGPACRMVTVRERMRNGNVLIRKIRRCG